MVRLVLGSAVIALAATPATAAPPTVGEVQAAVLKLREAVPASYDNTPTDVATAKAILATPLWFDGFRYSFVGDDADVKVLRRACRKHGGKVSTAAGLDAFLQCFGDATWRYSIDGEGQFTALDLAKIPSVFRKHRSRLRALARDHQLVYTHFCPAAPGDFWTLYAATKDAGGQVHIDTFLVFNEKDGDCRDH